MCCILKRDTFHTFTGLTAAHKGEGNISELHEGIKGDTAKRGKPKTTTISAPRFATGGLRSKSISSSQFGSLSFYSLDLNKVAAKLQLQMVNENVSDGFCSLLSSKC